MTDKEKLKEAQKRFDKLNEEFEGDSHENYENCYVPKRDS